MTFPAHTSYKASGVDWLDAIPSHWNVQKFRWLFRESPEKISETVVGPMLSVSGYRGIEIKEYDDENRRRLDEELVGYRIVREGQLVVNTMWLNYAGLGVSDHEGHVSPAYRSYWISADLNRRYIHHLMRSDLYVKGYTRLLTGIRPNSLQMSRDDLMSFPVLVPPLPEQKAIATFLDRETGKIDTLVDEQRRLIELLKEKRQAVISHAVTKGLNPAAPMNPSGIEWLGDVPEHWGVAPLKYLVSIRSGGTPSKDNRDFWDGDIPWVSARDLKAEVLCDTTYSITDAAVECGAASCVPAGSVLVLVRGMMLARAFPVCVISRPMAINQDLKALSGNGRLANPYLAWLLRGLADESLRRIDEAGHGTKALRMEAWTSILVPVPPVQEQDEIAAALDTETARLDALVSEAESAIALLQERRSALISAAVTGKIDVRGMVPAETEAA